jgi:Ca2+-binding RTX toxin-like protein
MRLLNRTSVAAGLLLAGVAATADAASAAPSARVKANGTLVLKGTSARDDITLRVRSARPNRLEIDLGDDGSADLDFAKREVDRIRVRARGGNDRVRIDDSEVPFTTAVPTLLEGQAGNDRLTGGAGGERFAGGRGRDRFRWAPGDGDDIVAGGQGRDDLTLKGSTAAEVLTVTPDGTRARLRRDVDGVEVRLGRVERIAVLARRGADTVSVGDLTGTGIKRVGADVGAGDGALDRLAVAGTTGADTIEAAGTATIAGLAAVVALAGAEPADRLTIDAGRGADRISAETLTGVELTADGGPDGDTILGGGTAETLLGGDGIDTINGNGGRDVARLGGDDDTFAWQPGDGSDVVEGEGGRDTMRFAGAGASEQFAVEPDGNRVRYTRDIGGIVMDLDDVERIDTLAFGGADTVTAGDVAGTDLDEFNADLDADGAADRVMVRGTGAGDAVTATGSGGTASVTGLQNGLAVAVIGAQAPQDTLVLDMLGGDDRVSADALAPDSLALAADGGADADTLLGSPGADRLRGGAGVDTVDGNGGDDVALLGGEDDTFAWDPGDGSDIVEGDEGRDTLRFAGSGADERFAVSPDGRRVHFTRDVGDIVMDLDGVEQIGAAALGGADVLTVDDTAATDLVEVDADLAGVIEETDKVNVNATEDDDVVLVTGASGTATVFGTVPAVRITHGDAADDQLGVHLLAGADVLDASALAADAIALQAQGGSENDVLIGGDGPDTLLGGPDNDLLMGGPGIDTLDGGTGSNTLIQD